MVATLKEIEILRPLYDADNLTALAIARKNDINRGSVYSLLQRLEKKGYLKSRVDPKHRISRYPHRYYSLTKAGRKSLHAQLRRILPDSLLPKAVLQG